VADGDIGHRGKTPSPLAPKLSILKVPANSWLVVNREVKSNWHSSFLQN